MAGIDPFLSSNLRELTPEAWDGLLRMVERRLLSLEERASVQDGIASDVVRRGLQVIEDALTPSIGDVTEAVEEAQGLVDRLREDVQFGGMFHGQSSSSVNVGLAGGTRSFVVSDPGGFVPTAFLVAMVNGDPTKAIAGLLASWDAVSGALSLSVTKVTGSGTYSDWVITPMSSTDDVEAARAAAVAAAVAASGSAEAAADALTTAQEVTSRYHGARASAPGSFLIGDLYLDTSTTPNVMRVRTSTGWSPTVTVSIGGTRNQNYVATAGQTVFAVDGGFTGGDVYKNGALLRVTEAYSLDPDAGTFTLVAAATAGDKVSFRGYLANDATDFYSKSQVNALLGPLATKESPAFTGEPTAPTAAVGTNSGQLASTAFVLAQIATSAPVMDGAASAGASKRLAAADHVHPTDTSRAPLASPALTGNPTAPTQATTDSSTKLATTAHVWAALNQIIGNLMTGAVNGQVLQKVSGAWVARTVADMLNTGIGYEIGTFNPALSATGVEPVVTYTDRQGQYVRIGRHVTFRAEIAGTYSNAPTGSARIGSVPFAASGGGFYMPFRSSGVTLNGAPMASVATNGTILLSYIQANGADVDLNISSVSGSGFRIICSGSYMIP